MIQMLVMIERMIVILYFLEYKLYCSWLVEIREIRDFFFFFFFFQLEEPIKNVHFHRVKILSLFTFNQTFKESLFNFYIQQNQSMNQLFN